MKFSQFEEVSSEDFRRLTGIKRTTFDKMTIILKDAEIKFKSRGGKRNKLVIEDRLLMTLEYLREYRTYFHISCSYGISESSCYRNIRRIEDVLIKSGEFSLPGKKELVKSDIKYEVILIDATESPIERPKKDKSVFIQARRRDIPLRHK